MKYDRVRISQLVMAVPVILLSIFLSSSSVHPQTNEPQAISRWIQQLEDVNEDIQWKAAAKLWKAGPSAISPLISALGHEDPDVRANVATILGRIGDGQAVSPLCAALQDKHKEVRRNAAWALGEIGNIRAIGCLEGALDDEDYMVRWEARRALEEFCDSAPASQESERGASRCVKAVQIEVSESHVTRILTSWPFFLQCQTVLNYAGIRPVEQKEGKERCQAVLHIAATGTAVSAKYRTAENESRYSGASMGGDLYLDLGKVSSRRFHWGAQVSPPHFIWGDSYKSADEAPFRDALDNSSSFLLAVFKAVECIKGVKSLIAAARPKSQSGVGYAATQAFRESEDSHAVQPLISALSHADPDIRCIAAKVLGGLKDPRAIDPLIAAALQERNPAVVSSAAQAFEEITAQRPWSDLAKWWEE